MGRADDRHGVELVRTQIFARHRCPVAFGAKHRRRPAHQNILRSATWLLQREARLWRGARFFLNGGEAVHDTGNGNRACMAHAWYMCCCRVSGWPKGKSHGKDKHDARHGLERPLARPIACRCVIQSIRQTLFTGRCRVYTEDQDARLTMPFRAKPETIIDQQSVPPRNHRYQGRRALSGCGRRHDCVRAARSRAAHRSRPGQGPCGEAGQIASDGVHRTICSGLRPNGQRSEDVFKCVLRARCWSQDRR